MKTNILLCGINLHSKTGKILINYTQRFLLPAFPTPHRRENQLSICFTKEFLTPRRPDNRSSRSTNNFRGLHCFSKAPFSSRPRSREKCDCQKTFLLSHKDVRRRELEFPNMLIRAGRELRPLPPRCSRVHSARWKISCA